MDTMFIGLAGLKQRRHELKWQYYLLSKNLVSEVLNYKDTSIFKADSRGNSSSKALWIDEFTILIFRW